MGVIDLLNVQVPDVRAVHRMQLVNRLPMAGPASTGLERLSEVVQLVKLLPAQNNQRTPGPAGNCIVARIFGTLYTLAWVNTICVTNSYSWQLDLIGWVHGGWYCSKCIHTTMTNKNIIWTQLWYGVYVSGQCCCTCVVPLPGSCWRHRSRRPRWWHLRSQSTIHASDRGQRIPKVIYIVLRMCVYDAYVLCSEAMAFWGQQKFHHSLT